jgi:hypothetical protein
VTVVGSGVSTTIDSGGTIHAEQRAGGHRAAAFSGSRCRAYSPSAASPPTTAADRRDAQRPRPVHRRAGEHVNGRGVDVNGRIDAINAAARTLQVAGSTVMVAVTIIGTARVLARRSAVGDPRHRERVSQRRERTATGIKVTRDDDDDDDGEDDTTGGVATVSL